MIKIGNSASNISVYTCQPNNKSELIDIVQDRIESEGPKCDLNDIDVSLIDDMSSLFYRSDFNGDISKWNVSKVKTMHGMFSWSKFNGDISNWDVRNVKSMTRMFSGSAFNQDISNWDVSKVRFMYCMFEGSKFDQDISNWKISKYCDVDNIFMNCPIKKENKPKLP